MPDRVYTLAAELLAAVVDAAADHTPDPIVLPERRFVSNGEVAFDCPQVAVQTPRVFRGLAGQPFSDVVRAGDVFTAEYTIWLTRKVPTFDQQGNPPSGDKIQQSAQTILDDGWLLTIGLLPKLKVVAESCMSLAIGDCVGVGPEGGHGGWQLTVHAGL